MWDPRDESASKVYFDSVAQRAMFLFPSSNTDARVLPARTTLCPRVYGERRKWLKSSRTIYVSYVVSSKWKIQRESTVLIKLCLETPLSGVVVDYRIAINVWGGGRKLRRVLAILHLRLKPILPTLRRIEKLFRFGRWIPFFEMMLS